MKALSIRQPYAALCVLGVKPYETRAQRTKHRGKLTIQAAATWTRKIEAAAVELLADLEPLLSLEELNALFAMSGQHRYREIARNLPRGKVVGTVHLSEVFEIGQYAHINPAGYTGFPGQFGTARWPSERDAHKRIRRTMKPTATDWRMKP